MKLYQELAKHQISKKELRKLYWKWKFTKDRKTKNTIINSFLPMALEIASKILKNHPYIELMELFNEAYLIIDKAIDYYDGRAEMSTFIYHMLRWNFKNYIFKQCSPVKYPNDIKKKMKEDGTSFNPIYFSEVDKDCFIQYRNPEKTLMEKQISSQLWILLKKYLSEKEIEKLYNKKKTKKLEKKLKAISKEEWNAIFGI